MKKERFSIRKTSRGAVSACIAVLGLFALSLSAQDVHADSQPAEALPTVTSLGEVLGDQEEATSETIEIASPVTYVADETKAVGETEVVQPGQDGKLVITGELPDKTVTLEAPSETVVAVGTKPLIEEVLTEKAETEYVANEQLEAGKTLIVQEGQDGARVTTTSHKVVEKPALLSNQTDNYEGQTAYTIDNTKELASDKVVIDEAAVRAELAGLTTEDEWLAVLADSVNVLGQSNSLDKGLPQEDYLTKFFDNQMLTEAQLADIKAAYIRFQEAVAYFKQEYTAEELKALVTQPAKEINFFTRQNKSLLNEANYTQREVVIDLGLKRVPKELDLPFSTTTSSSKNAIYFKHLDDLGIAYQRGSHYWDIIIDGFNYRIESERVENPETKEVSWTYNLKVQEDSQTLLPWQMVDAYGPSRNAIYKNYLAELTKQGVAYEVISENGLRIDGIDYRIDYDFSSRYKAGKSLEELTPEDISKNFEKLVGRLETAYETYLKRYDNNHGAADQLNIVYETNRMTDEEKTWFEQQVSSLPTAIKKLLLKVTIVDNAEEEEVAIGRAWAGVALYINNEIKLNYSALGSKERMLKVLMHELVHVIDNRTFTISDSKEFNGYKLGQLTKFVDFDRADFVDVEVTNENSLYFTYFNPDIDQKNPAVRPYYRNYVGESFAEFFSDYIMTRHFPDYQPVKFYNLGGDAGEKGILTLRSYDWGYSPEDIPENRANYEKYYNDPAAYSPMKATEWWFAKLYNQLFEQPTTAEVVVNQVKTEVLAVKPKIVEVGTKPLVVREETAFTSREEQSADLPLGQRQVVQKGQVGIVEKTTTYELVDKKTGQVVSKTVSQVIQDMIEEIIAVGTKIVEAEPVKTDKPKTDDVVTPPTKTEDKEPNRPNQQAEGDKVKEDKVVKEPKQPVVTGKQEEQPAKVLTSSPKPVPSGEKPTTYSRRQESQTKQTLPATGDRLTLLTIAGLSLTVLGLAGLKRPRS